MEAWSWRLQMRLSIGRAGWMSWSSRSRGVFAGLSRAGGFEPICRVCWLRWSARTAGNWPRMPGIVRPTGCRTFSPACAGMPARRAMTPACAGAGSAGVCRCAIGRCRGGAGPGPDWVCQEREQVGRGAAAVFGHSGAHRELPDRGVSRLCQPARSRADRPRPVSARGLGQYPDPEGRRRNAGGYGFRHQTTARAADADISLCR